MPGRIPARFYILQIIRINGLKSRAWVRILRGARDEFRAPRPRPFGSPANRGRS